MGEESKPFTVTDRRKFTATGELRGDVSESAHEAGADVPVRETPERDASVPHSSVAEAAGSLGSPERDSEPVPSSQQASGDAVDLSSFIYSLAMQASQLLSSPGQEDVQGARHMISILEMLEAKTAGNRDEQEEGLLEKVLYELRMAYVARMQGHQ